jgi:uncharacterized protein YndB with AHSA1/START domain
MSLAATDPFAERGYYSAAEKVFWAFLDEDIARKFILGLSAGKVTTCQIEAKVGGRILLIEERDGRNIVYEGQFTALEVPSRIGFTLNHENVSIQVLTGKDPQAATQGSRVQLCFGESIDAARSVLEALALAIHDRDQAPATTALVHRLFSVSADEVFDAWLDPEAIGKFLFSVEDGRDEILEIRLQAEVGGAFAFVIRRAGQRIVHGGTYLVLHRPVRLSFTWGAQEDAGRSEVALEIAPAPDGCEVFLTQELPPEWASFKPQAEAAWKKILHQLASLLGSD